MGRPLLKNGQGSPAASAQVVRLAAAVRPSVDCAGFRSCMRYGIRVMCCFVPLFYFLQKGCSFHGVAIRTLSPSEVSLVPKPPMQDTCLYALPHRCSTITSASPTKCLNHFCLKLYSDTTRSGRKQQRKGRNKRKGRKRWRGRVGRRLSLPRYFPLSS